SPHHSWMTTTPGPFLPSAGVARYPLPVPPLLGNSTISPTKPTPSVPACSFGPASAAQYRESGEHPATGDPVPLPPGAPAGDRGASPGGQEGRWRTLRASSRDFT